MGAEYAQIIIVSTEVAVDVLYLDLEEMTEKEDAMWRTFKFGGRNGEPLDYRTLVTSPQHRELARWLLGDYVDEVDAADEPAEAWEPVADEEHSTCWRTLDNGSSSAHCPPGSGDIVEVYVIVCGL